MAAVGYFSLGSQFGEVTLNLASDAEVLGVIYFGGLINLAVRTPASSAGVTKYTFYVVGNGQEVPDHAKYVGQVHHTGMGTPHVVFFAPAP